MSEKYEIITIVCIALFGLIFKTFISPKTSINGIQGPADATIYGYSITLLSTIILLIYINWLSNKDTIQETSFKSIIRLIKNSMPGLLFISVLIWAIVINGIFKDKINKGNVVNDYSKFEFISTLLIIFQFIIFVTYIYNMSKNIKIKYTPLIDSVFNKFSDVFTQTLPSFIYLFTVVNYLILGIKHSSLQFFSTDG
jgi:hypothetical protein